MGFKDMERMVKDIIAGRDKAHEEAVKQSVAPMVEDAAGDVEPEIK